MQQSSKNPFFSFKINDSDFRANDSLLDKEFPSPYFKKNARFKMKISVVKWFPVCFSETHTRSQKSMRAERILSLEQYIPISEAITVMLCHAASSRSRLLVVLMSPLLASMLKSVSPSAFWSMKYLKLKNGKFL